MSIALPSAATSSLICKPMMKLTLLSSALIRTLEEPKAVGSLLPGTPFSADSSPPSLEEAPSSSSRGIQETMSCTRPTTSQGKLQGLPHTLGSIEPLSPSSFSQMKSAMTSSTSRRRTTLSSSSLVLRPKIRRCRREVSGPRSKFMGIRI